MKLLTSIAISLAILCFGFIGIFKTGTEQTAFVKKLNSTSETHLKHHAREKLYLHTDRTIYKPGDNIWFSAYLTNGATHKASTQSEILYAELISPSGKVEQKRTFIVNEGRVSGEFFIGTNFSGGNYQVKAYTKYMRNFGEEASFAKSIQVLEVSTPQLLMKLDFERKAYGAGDEVTAVLKLEKTDNTPLNHQVVDYKAQLNGKDIVVKHAKTDADGNAVVRFKLPDNLTTNDGLLNVMIDHKGTTESIARPIPIVLKKIDLQFFPEGGQLVSGVSTKLAFKALNEFGKPADIEGVIYDGENQIVTTFKSFHFGMGATEIELKTSNQYVAKITKPKGITTTYKLPEVLPEGYNMAVTNLSDKVLSVSVHSPIKKPVTLVADVRGKVCYSKEVNLNIGSNKLIIPVQKFPMGIARVTLFDHKNQPQCERLTFVNKKDQLNIEVTTNKEKYLPREKVEMKIKVKDSKGNPVAAGLSLAVAEDKLTSFADDRQDNILSYLMLSSEVKGKVHEPAFYFKEGEPKANQTLEYLLMTQGWRGFEWKKILNKPKKELLAELDYAPEKRIIKGRVLNMPSKAYASFAKVSLVETQQDIKCNDLGYFEIKGLDLTAALTMRVDAGDGLKRTVQLTEYSQEYLEKKTLKGKVVGESGSPISMCNVVVKGSTWETRTTAEGKFGFGQLPVRSEAVLLKKKGYEDLEVSIAQLKDSSAIVMRRKGSTNTVGDELKNAPKKQAERKHKKVNLKEFDSAKPPPPPPKKKPAPQKSSGRNYPKGDVDVSYDVAPAMIAMPDVAIVIEPEVFAFVEQMPDYPGGMGQMYKYMADNVRYPHYAREAGIQGKVYVRFVVERDGRITNAEILRGIGGGCDEEALRIVRGLPKFTPGKQRGKAVRVSYVLPISFKLSGSAPGYDSQFHGNRLYVELANTDEEKGYTYIKQKPTAYYKTRTFYKPKYEEQPTQKIKRDDFRKTIHWEPNLQIDSTGETSISFYNSDEISSFRTVVEGIASNGSIGRKEHKHYTQLPFDLQVKLPQTLTFYDQVSVPVTMTNTTNQSIEGRLYLKAPKAFKLSKKHETTYSIPANSSKTTYIEYEMMPQEMHGTFAAHFESDGLNDNMELPVQIIPKGFPNTATISGGELQKTVPLEISNPIEGTLQAEFEAYPDAISTLMASMESMFREPTGCFEQTSSKLYPNILALQFMQQTNTIDVTLQQKVLGMINRGYKKLTTFALQDGSYEWYGKSPGHEGLTAYALLEFNDMKQVYKGVEPKLIERAIQFLISRSDGQGGFNQSRGKHGFSGPKKEVGNAYITYALSEVGYTELDEEIKRIERDVKASGDLYQMALLTNTLFNLKQSEKAEQQLAELVEQFTRSGPGHLRAVHSITRSKGISLQIETTSLVMLAMMRSEKDYSGPISKGFGFLLNSRRSGRFGSTQATIQALKALTAYARIQNLKPNTGTVELFVNSEKVMTHTFTKRSVKTVSLKGLEKYLKEGQQNITVSFLNTEKAIPYSFEVKWVSKQPASNESCELQLETTLAKNEIKTGETVRMKTTIRNKSATGQPSTIAMVGIPAGLSVQPWQLKEIQEKNVVDYFEMHENYLVFHYREMPPGGFKSINLDLKAELPGTYEAPAGRTYLYYNDEYKHWTSGEKIKINR
jgi:TonB family protein